MAQEWIKSLMENDTLKVLVKALSPYLEELQKFQFSPLNPLFWICVLILLLILTRRWAFKKAFSYCLVVSILLLVTTALEKYILNRLGADEMPGFIVRIISIFLLSLISVYYFFVRIDS